MHETCNKDKTMNPHTKYKKENILWWLQKIPNTKKCNSKYHAKSILNAKLWIKFNTNRESEFNTNTTNDNNIYIVPMSWQYICTVFVNQKPET